MSRLHVELVCAFLLPAFVAACGSDGEKEESNGGPEQFLTEIGDKGWFDYMGKFEPSSQDPVGDITKYHFAVTADGPQCIDSTEYGIVTRDQGSRNLVIFLMGGGACWTDFAFCNASVGNQIDMLDTGGPAFMNPSNATFPTATWNHAVFPYCDGSVFAGDREADFFGTDVAAWAEGTEVVHGLQNLTAGLDAVKAQFPTADRVLLAGTSAGGFGTLWAAGLVRKLYTDAEILVFNDAGVGILKDDDPSFRAMQFSEFGTGDRFPASCTECVASPHIIPIVPWGLALDPKLKTAAFSADSDDVIAGFFLGYGEDKSVWTAALMRETDAIHDEYPERFKRFIIPGGQHTSATAWDTTTKNGVTIEAWLAAFVNGDDSVWTDMP